ncbi:MAG: hypothetical protein AMXMBFR53_39270 [Gemmatimonadota bacterium]
MTLRFGVEAPLAGETERLARLLRGVGVRAVPADTPGNGALEALRDGAVTLAAVAGPTAAAACAGPGLVVLAVLGRDEPRDILVAGQGSHASLPTLASGSRVGLSGARRRGYLRAHRPDLVPVPPENGGGPVKALLSRSVDAVIVPLAEARGLSLHRLGSEVLDAKAWVPGAGQGATVLLGRAGETPPPGLGALDDPPSGVAFRVEAAAAAALRTAGELPAGFLAVPFGAWIRAWGMVASPDGRSLVRGDLTGSVDEPEALGFALADLLERRGAGRLLETQR